MVRARRRGRLATVLTSLVLGLVAPLGAGLPAQAAPPETSHLRETWQQPIYVALGDSYSSGQGTFVYYPDTNTATNQCHRSPLAYPALLSSRTQSLRPLAFVACSGATTRDLYSQNRAFPDEPAQLDAVTSATKTVTLTIGGNDVGFATVAAACVQSPHTGSGCSQSPLASLVQARIAALAGLVQLPDIVAISRVLADIHAKAPDAHIMVAGYPKLFGDSATTFSFPPTAPSELSCVVNAESGARVAFADAQWINSATEALNAVLQGAVAAAAAAGISATYISPATFDDHALCDEKKPWIRPVLVDGEGHVLPESFHPTRKGHRHGYLTAFALAGL